ncbi:MAG TPA: glucose-6-phosphate dehydrogenase assembly protein OpcA, partial [Candidatus Saccharimonadales bacterium]|nr:glucose-6-phosphate dehydrogenase assembly protein OpcA [Candidatus Saccharimonadales bacterium]
MLDAPEGSRPFDPVAIENDLRNMWKKAGGGDSAHTGAIYRAALANLVVPLDPPFGAKLSPVLVEVTRRHPSRLFSIGAGAAKEGLRARIGAICHRRESGGGLVCSEQVVLDSDAASAALIPSAVRALLVGDLPTVLLHFHPRIDLPWVKELMDLSDLILVDSCLVEPGTEPSAWRFIEREGSCKVHDLAWARLTPWRAILAEVFDEKKYLPSLGTIRSVEIVFGGRGFPPPPAWLFAGWLASRLGWAPEGGDSSALRFRSGSGRVTLTLKGTGEGEERALERIRIQSGEPHPFEASIHHHGHDHTAQVTVKAPRESSSE